MSVNLVFRPWFALLVACLIVDSGFGWEPNDQRVAEGTHALSLVSDTLSESSGLAFSHANQDCFWTHNDSGGKARLLAFDNDGKPTGQADLRGVKANDWEAMESFIDEVPRLLIADVGDNDAQRDDVSIYLFDEPDPKDKSTIESYQHLVVRYAGGPQNCEAVAVDMVNRKILLLSKSPLMATMHQIDLPNRVISTDRLAVVQTEVMAVPIQRVGIPLATGMAWYPKTGDIWVSNYLQAFRYAGNHSKTLRMRLREVPVMHDLPKLKQVEAISVDPQGRVWVTTEGKPARIQRVKFEN